MKQPIPKRDRGPRAKTPNTSCEFLKQLWEIIERNQWSRKHICQMAGVNEQYITHAVTGQHNATITNMEAIAEVMGYKIVLVPIEEHSCGEKIEPT